MAKLIAGDDSAWAEWFNDHGPRVWSYVAKLTGAESATVADIVQDIFLAAAKGLHGFDASRGTLISWLLGIAHRQAALFWRRQHRHQEQFEAWSQEQWTALLEGSQAADTSDQELASAVRSVIARLPQDAAAVLMGHYLEHRSTAELADDLRISEQAVRSRLSRARETFRGIFATAHREYVTFDSR